jgi:hypothetical protein
MIFSRSPAYVMPIALSTTDPISIFSDVRTEPSSNISLTYEYIKNSAERIIYLAHYGKFSRTLLNRPGTNMYVILSTSNKIGFYCFRIGFLSLSKLA